MSTAFKHRITKVKSYFDDLLETEKATGDVAMSIFSTEIKQELNSNVNNLLKILW